MKGDVKVIEALNEILVGELTAINQYFLHARMCKSWGYQKLAEVLRKESISEMKHASDLTDRILFLEGVPNFQKLGRLQIGEDVKEQLNSDLALELQAIPLLKKAIELCYDAHDHTSRELLESILKEEEGHAAWLEEQISLVSALGYQNYLTQQV
jgi:bacterioferritin